MMVNNPVQTSSISFQKHSLTGNQTLINNPFLTGFPLLSLNNHNNHKKQWWPKAKNMKIFNKSTNVIVNNNNNRNNSSAVAAFHLRTFPRRFPLLLTNASSSIGKLRKLKIITGRKKLLSTNSKVNSDNFKDNNYSMMADESSPLSLSSLDHYYGHYHYHIPYQGLVDYWPFDQHHSTVNLRPNHHFPFGPIQQQHNHPISSSPPDDARDTIVAEIDPIRSQPLLLDLMHVNLPIQHENVYHQNSHHHDHHVPTYDDYVHNHEIILNQPMIDEAILLDTHLDHGHYDHHDHDIHHMDHHHLEHHPELLELEEELELPFQKSPPIPPLAPAPLLPPPPPQPPTPIIEQKTKHIKHPEDWNTLETVPPVAKKLLSSSSSSSSSSDDNHYYTPFKVNPINVYSRYLANSDDDDNDDDDDDEHDEKCQKDTHLTSKDVEDAVNDGVAGMKTYANIIRQNAEETNRREPFIPAGVLDSKIFEFTTLNLKKDKCLSKMDVITVLPKINPSKIHSHYEMNACQQDDRIICEPKAKFRSIDGSCNNIKMKTWGKSFTCHRRLIPPDYADGVAAPRKAYDGGPLPNARELSSILLPDIDIQDHKLTSMTMAFGQFIIHDIARTLPTASDIRCCPSQDAEHPECFAIDIRRPDDVLRKQFNQTCINFVRSIVCNPCALGPREQQNQATQTFDMSHMYGLRLNESLSLRTLRGGKLRASLTSSYPKEELPPKMTREDPGCNVRPKPPRFKCFETADGLRASQHPALQALHTAFHRRHNQHAENLAKVNPHWSDEKLYQEARHIMIAEVSTIIYGQYLSAIFGKNLMKHFRLGVKKYGYTKYDPKLNPATIQEFIVAAGRFGHSQINRQFRVLLGDYKMSYSYMLRDNFFETTIVSLGQSGGILKGLATDATRASDPYFVDDVKNSLYHLRRERLGRDLPAFNIQRGRDHGIPGYVFYLDFCFGHKVKHWNDLATFIPKKYLKKLRMFYKHWTDIDLFVGGVMERLLHGAAFGPTFGCINGIQFYNFKYGDRFYFEHGYQSGSFSPEQLQHIRKVSSLSGLICKTHNEIDQMPSNPFVRTSPHDNPMVPCFKFEDFDYKLWMDKKKYKNKSKHGHASIDDDKRSSSVFISQHHGVSNQQPTGGAYSKKYFYQSNDHHHHPSSDSFFVNHNEPGFWSMDHPLSENTATATMNLF